MPVLIDEKIAGKLSKLVAVANRNGFFYARSRERRIPVARPYTEVTWAKEIDAKGRPVVLPDTDPPPRETASAQRDWRHQWHSSSYSPQTRLFYFFSNEQCDTFMADDSSSRPIVPAVRSSAALSFRFPGEKMTPRSAPSIRRRERAVGVQTVRGRVVRSLSTAGGLVFQATDREISSRWMPTREGFVAPPARRADPDRSDQLRGGWPTYVAITAGDALFAFALRREP